ncbi:helix-turn-helix domain-containing protein [Streptomyces sp. NPDC001480]|uniref:helix-turn-helix domain-containing protein n=1 Tax=Streptomyces sp. NPDC001480 TaxID=3364577 RepID=UPI0036BC2DBF
MRDARDSVDDGGTVSARGDVERFAELLRRLKDRTDRSYGSLARRVNMNTSTLHRYCAGEAVPQDFAPVERLAAFCGATPEERLELHRLWLLAVAARQRVRTAGGAGEEPVGEAPAAVEEAAAPQVAEEPGPSPAPAPAPRPWYRRRRVLVSTAVACGLLATLGSLPALPTDRSPDVSGPHVSSGPRTTAPTTPHRSSKPEPSADSSPTDDRSSSSPVAKHKAPGSSAPGSSAAGTNPTGAGKPATGLPVTWSADSQVWKLGCGHDYVIDKPPTQVPPPPVQQDAAAWAATQGAVHGRQTMVQISVQGRSSTAVVLEALRVRIVSRGNPAAGNAYAMDQGCGGEITPRGFTVNLDADRPIARPKDGADSEHTIPAVHFPYRVSAEDPEVLLVDATTQTYDARWYLELDWSSQGRTGTIRIDDHGRPFHTSSIKGMPRYWYGTNDSGGRQWVPYGN